MKRESWPRKIFIAAAILSAAGLALTTTALVTSILADRPPRSPEELDRNLRFIERQFVLQMTGAPLLACGVGLETYALARIVAFFKEVASIFGPVR